MPEYSVCLETVFVDLPYHERIRRLSGLGFKNLEFWHPEGTWDGRKINDLDPKDAATLRDVLSSTGTRVVGFVLNAWDGLYGGCPVNADDHGRFFEQVHAMVEFGRYIGCSSAIIMPGVEQEGMSREQLGENTMHAFSEAASIALGSDFTLLLEPLNTKVDHPGFFLESAEEAVDMIERLGAQNIKLLYDIYHAQITAGNVVATMRDYIDYIGHVHIAGVPGRAEPDHCELNYRYVVEEAVRLGFRGLFGLEYFPRMDSEKSLIRQMQLFA